MPSTLTCEGCNLDFVLESGRGMFRRVMCYTCQPFNGDRKRTDRNKHMKRKYGITLGQYTLMYQSQNGCCKICNNLISFEGSDLKKGVARDSQEPCIDHCHASGQVRGILCFHCNTALGHVFDNTQLLQRMIQYLEHNPPLDNKSTD